MKKRPATKQDLQDLYEIVTELFPANDDYHANEKAHNAGLITIGEYLAIQQFIYDKGGNDDPTQGAGYAENH